MLRKIHFHGALKQLCPEGVSVDAATALEAVNGACRLIGLKPDPRTGRHMVKVRGFDTVNSLSAPSDVEELHLVPAFLGGKNVLGSIVRIVVGAVLIVAGVITGQAYLVSFGASLVVGGLISLLFPVKTADQQFSHYLGAPGNTTKIGTRIPLIFGKSVKAYGHILSYNIQAVG